MARMEKIYLQRGNRIRRELTRDGESLSSNDKSAISRVQAWINESVCLDTDNADDPIEYADGYVTIQGGLASGLVEGTYEVKLTVYDLENPEGLAWGSFQVEVVSWPVCEE